MLLTLVRDYRSDTATVGTITLPTGAVIHTLERPWIPCRFTTGAAPAVIHAPCGAKGVSCVPRGGYELVPHESEAHPHTVALVNRALWVYHFDADVPFYEDRWEDQRGLARTTVLIHPANYVSELRGCIAPGLSRLGETVLQSRLAFEKLAPYLRTDAGKAPTLLRIVEDFRPRV